MLIEPYAMLNEAAVFNYTMGKGDVMDRLTVDPLCRVITPYHWILNRIREKARGIDRHGSCGMGIGEVRHFQEMSWPTIVAGEIADYDRTLIKLREIRSLAFREAEQRTVEDRKWIAAEHSKTVAEFYQGFSKRMRLLPAYELQRQLRKCISVFEGAQGILLDENYGFAPYNSWTNTTAKNAKRILTDASIPHTTIGIVRTYFTRHGPGPFVSECEPTIEDRHNGTGQWQGRFRTGLFDLPALRYSLRCAGGIEEIGLTHVDQVGRVFKYIDAYKMPDGRVVKEAGELRMPCQASDLEGAAPIIKEKRIEGDNLVSSAFQELIGLPIKYVSWGETAREKASLEEVE